jgi:hypothetical protein
VHLVGVVCVEERVGQTDSIMLPLREAEVNFNLSFNYHSN